MFSFLFGRKRKISGKVASSRLKQLLLSGQNSLSDRDHSIVFEEILYLHLANMSK